MGEKDLTENYLEAYNDVFAYIINVLLCDGKQVILQEHLEADGNKTIYKADRRFMSRRGTFPSSGNTGISR